MKSKKYILRYDIITVFGIRPVYKEFDTLEDAYRYKDEIKKNVSVIPIEIYKTLDVGGEFSE